MTLIALDVAYYRTWCDIFEIYDTKVLSKIVSLSSDSCAYKNIFHWRLCVAYAL
jgi:hypothetical protein